MAHRSFKAVVPAARLSSSDSNSNTGRRRRRRRRRRRGDEPVGVRGRCEGGVETVEE